MLEIVELTDEYTNKLWELMNGSGINIHDGIDAGNHLVTIDYHFIDFIRPTEDSIIIMIKHEAIAIPRVAFYQIEMA